MALSQKLGQVDYIRSSGYVALLSNEHGILYLNSIIASKYQSLLNVFQIFYD